VGSVPILIRRRHFRRADKDIFITLSGEIKPRSGQDREALGAPLPPRDTLQASTRTHETNVNDNSSGIRPGEIAVALPERYDASLYYIGRIRTPWTRLDDCPKNARESQAVCTIELDPRWAQALSGVESCSHLVVLYWMDKSRRDLVVQVPRHYGTGRGTFALRSPARPNPIAVSVVRLLGIEGTRLKVVGLDCLDNTPLIDIKPYFASTDAVGEAVVGWHATGKSGG
jgi:tRNA-Thr(GGU) m(6)t(6)A37 methyltransferase TsaA